MKITTSANTEITESSGNVLAAMEQIMELHRYNSTIAEINGLIFISRKLKKFQVFYIKTDIRQTVL